jgi:predicted DNA-binding transcriptional regulator AlpA
VATYAVVSQLPDKYRDELPSPDQIAERLQAWVESGVRDGE